jgi:hypothetical protein
MTIALFLLEGGSLALRSKLDDLTCSIVNLSFFVDWRKTEVASYRN